MSSVYTRFLLVLKHVFYSILHGSEAPPVRDDPLVNLDLGPGDVAIDCGANVGDITARMAKTGASVYAFEPNPYAYYMLQQRFKEFSDVHCINKGVLDRDGMMRLYMHENSHRNEVHWSTGSSLLAFKDNVDPETYVEIEVVDLARFISELGRCVKVVKMDVEGVECQIINRLIDTGLVKRIELLLVETHEEKIPELREPIESLRERITEEELSNVSLDWI